MLDLINEVFGANIVIPEEINNLIPNSGTFELPLGLTAQGALGDVSSTITIGDGSVITADTGNVTINAKAESQVHLYTIAVKTQKPSDESTDPTAFETEDYGLTFSFSNATAQTLIQGTVAITATTGDVTIQSTVVNELDTKTWVVNGIKSQPTTGGQAQQSASGPVLSMTYGAATSDSDVNVSQLTTIIAKNVTITAQADNVFKVAGESLIVGVNDWGLGASIVISNVDSDATVTMAGNVTTTNGKTAVNAIGRNNDNSVFARTILREDHGSNPGSRTSNHAAGNGEDINLEIAAALVFAFSDNAAHAVVTNEADMAGSTVVVSSLAVDNHQAVAIGGSLAGGDFAFAGGVAFVDYSNLATTTVGSGPSGGETTTLAAVDRVDITSEAVVPNRVNTGDDLAKALGFSLTIPDFVNATGFIDFVKKAWDFVTDEPDPLRTDKHITDLLTQLEFLRDVVNRDQAVADRLATTYTGRERRQGDCGDERWARTARATTRPRLPSPAASRSTT